MNPVLGSSPQFNAGQSAGLVSPRMGTGTLPRAVVHGLLLAVFVVLAQAGEGPNDAAEEGRPQTATERRELRHQLHIDEAEVRPVPSAPHPAP